MAGGVGHVWCNAGDGNGTYYESNGAKPLITTKGKTYSYDTVCNFDEYIQKDSAIPKKDELAECLTQHTKLVSEATKKDKTINGLESEISKKETEIRNLKESLEENEGLNATQEEEIGKLNKQVSAYKGEVTKKENEIIELNKKIAEKPAGILVGKRKMLVGIMTPIVVAAVKIISEKMGVQLDTQEMLFLILAGLSYIGIEGAKDITMAVRADDNQQKIDK